MNITEQQKKLFGWPAQELTFGIVSEGCIRYIAKYQGYDIETVRYTFTGSKIPLTYWNGPPVAHIIEKPPSYYNLFYN